MERDLFIVDTTPNENDEENNGVELEKLFPLFSSSLFNIDSDEEEVEDEDKYFGLPSPSIRIKDALEKCPIKVEYFKKEAAKEIDEKETKFKDKLLVSLDSYLDELREKKFTFITDGIETKTDISELSNSKTQMKRLNRKERDKSKGSQWFNMKAPEMTEELKNELQVIQMRSSLDPKHFYKRSEAKTIPKYFEMGKIIESSVEYHNSKNIRKRKRTLVDELLADAEFQKFNKKKYQEAAEMKKKMGYKTTKKVTKLKKR